jgi:hypothetical protein
MVAEYLVERDKAAIKHRNAGPELYGSLRTVNVYGGARREAFPVTPTKTAISFRFARRPNETRA